MKAVLSRKVLSKPKQKILVRRFNAQRGVGLIEVLIALVIFALGVTGMAALQLRTMSVTMDLTQRSYVIAKSQDIADRIRSNGIPVALYLGTYSGENNFCEPVVAVSACADTVADTVGTCGTEQMATFGLHEAFCADQGSLEQQVVDWQTKISCKQPVAGVMTDTTVCDQLGARVTIDTSWFARSVDNDTATADSVRDSMQLSFVP